MDNKKVCPDCGEEVDFLKKTGICVSCELRRYNCKYSKKEYVPIINLSKEEKEKILSKRRGQRNKKKPKEIKSKNIINTKSESILDYLGVDEEKVRKDVEEDIFSEMERREVKDIQLKTEQLTAGMDFLTMICGVNFPLSGLRKIESTFNDFTNDFQHRSENLKTEDMASFVTNSIRENEVLVRRRPYKNLISQLQTLENLRNYIVRDETLVKLILDSKSNLFKAIKNQENPLYASKASGLILSEGNVLSEKKKVKQKYDVSVVCTNFRRRDSSIEVFDLIGGADVYNEEEAKKTLIRVLNTNFPKVLYNKEDIVVSLSKG